jgi:hypothetical protein
MGAKCLREPTSNLLHCCFRPLESVNSEREVQGLLNLPDSIVFAWRKHLRRVADGYPANGNRFPGSQVALEMHNPVEPYFAVPAEVS